LDTKRILIGEVMIRWLPDLVLMPDYGDNWERYLNVLYYFYIKDFIENKPIYYGKRLAVKKYPLIDGKEATFWHIIQEGQKEEQRIPDLRRCERIRWPKAIIENCNKCKIKIWENERQTKKGKQVSICIWFESKDYLIILRKRNNYILFWTSYPVTASHRKIKLEKEFNSYKNRQGTP